MELDEAQAPKDMQHVKLVTEVVTLQGLVREKDNMIKQLQQKMQELQLQEDEREGRRVKKAALFKDQVENRQQGTTPEEPLVSMQKGVGHGR